MISLTTHLEFLLANEVFKLLLLLNLAEVSNVFFLIRGRDIYLYHLKMALNLNLIDSQYIVLYIMPNTLTKLLEQQLWQLHNYSIIA